MGDWELYNHRKKVFFKITPKYLEYFILSSITKGSIYTYFCIKNFVEAVLLPISFLNFLLFSSVVKKQKNLLQFPRNRSTRFLIECFLINKNV